MQNRSTALWYLTTCSLVWNNACYLEKDKVRWKKQITFETSPGLQVWEVLFNIISTPDIPHSEVSVHICCVLPLSPLRAQVLSRCTAPFILQYSLKPHRTVGMYPKTWLKRCISILDLIKLGESQQNVLLKICPAAKTFKSHCYIVKNIWTSTFLKWGASLVPTVIVGANLWLWGLGSLSVMMLAMWNYLPQEAHVMNLPVHLGSWSIVPCFRRFLVDQVDCCIMVEMRFFFKCTSLFYSVLYCFTDFGYIYLWLLTTLRAFRWLLGYK